MGNTGISSWDPSVEDILTINKIFGFEYFRIDLDFSTETGSEDILPHLEQLSERKFLKSELQKIYLLE